jgi:hypothetical protein
MVKKVHADLVEETTLTTGDVDPYALEGALDGKQSFDVFDDGDTVFVCVTLGDDFEIVEGVFTLSGRTVSRARVLASSNSGSKVNWPAGTKTIRQVAPAELFNGLAGYKNPSVAGDKTNPGIEFGEHGTGIFHIVDGVTGYDALCFAMDAADHLRLYKTSTRIAVSLGWAFTSNVPGDIASGHKYEGTVAHLYGTTSTMIISGTTEANVVLNKAGASNQYRLKNDGTLRLERINASTGVVEETIFSYGSNGVVDFATTNGIAAANFRNSNSANTQVGYLSGDALPAIDSLEDVVVGFRALLTATTNINQVTAVGARSMEATTGGVDAVDFTTMVGAYSGRYNQASNNVGMGYRAVGGAPSGGGNATGEGNVGVGTDALYQLTTGETNTTIGDSTGNQLTTGSGVVFVGFQAGQHLGNVSDRLAIGNGPTAAECWIIGDASYNISLPANLTVVGSLTVGGTDVMPYIASIALIAAVNAGDIDDIKAIFAAAVADDTYTTAGGDEIEITSGVVTGFTPGSGGSSLVPHHVGHRLSLDSSDPYPLTDQTAKTVLNLVPHRDNLMRLYTGSAWVLTAISSLSFDVSTDNDIDAAAIANSSLYDVFVDYNVGSPQLAFKKWSNSGAGTSARAVALTRQDGVLVLTGATDHLFIGTVYVNSSTQLEDSKTNRLVGNYYNREPRRLEKFDDTTHSYNGGYRAWNNDTSLRVNFVLPYKRSIDIAGNFAAWTSSSRPNHGGVQLDATTGSPLESIENRANSYYRADISLAEDIDDGFHYLQMMEGTESSGSVNFYEARLNFTMAN